MSGETAREAVARAIRKAHAAPWSIKEAPDAWEPYAELAEAAIAALDAHRDAHGWQIVPKEPTADMREAATADEATKAVNGLVSIAYVHGASLPSVYTGENTPLLRWYRAMLAAAPKPPGE